MATTVSICNQALAMLGAKSIISLDDGTTEANLCKALYDPVRDAALEMGNWSFATKWLEIPRMANPPVGEYTSAFPLPPDVLRVIFVGTDFNHPEQWQREGNNIRKDGDKCKCQVLVREVDVTKYSPMFLQALATKLASELAIGITNSKTMAEYYYGLSDKKIREAINRDNAQGRSRKIVSKWLNESRATGPRSAGPYV
jgi:hypothetical protein